MIYLLTREEEALKRLKIAYPDLVVHEDKHRGYYLDHIPLGFVVVESVYQLVGIKSEVVGYVNEDHTMPILYQDHEQFFMIVLVDHAFDWEPVISQKRIFINHAIKKLDDE